MENTLEYKPEIYISYAWEKQEDGSNWPPVLKNLYQTLIDKGYIVHIDVNKLKYKDKIKAFMQELGKGKYIICLIGEKYLKSINCMYEVLQILKYPHYQDRIFPLLFHDALVYDSKKILQYLLYWENNINELNNEAKNLSSPAYAAPIFEDIEVMNEIRRALANFGDEIGNMNVLTMETHNSTNFKDLIESIENKIEIDKSTINLKIENINLKKEVLDLKAELEEIKQKYSSMVIAKEEEEMTNQAIELQSTLIKPEIPKEQKTKQQITDFENFLGFNRDSKINEAYSILGSYTKASNDKKYDFITEYFGEMVHLSYFRESKKLMVIRIKENNIYKDDYQTTINFLKQKGFNDSKINFLGKHKDKIIQTFGVPTTTNSDNYCYYFPNLVVNFICYSFNKYHCSEISVQYTG